MAEPLKFELVSPEKLLLSEDVESVVVPGSEGYFTVFAQHAPLMSTLKPGQIEVKAMSGVVEKFYVRGGFADVTPNGLTILAEQAIPLSEVDAAVLAQELKNAEEDLADAGQHEQRRRLAEGRLNELKDLQRWLIPA
jgi:F-type H+-transporting ATPase subunit epsilon